MHPAVLIGILLLVLAIIYVIFLIYAYNNKTFIFSPYVPNYTDPNFFQPGGDVVELTPEEIQCNQFLAGVPGISAPAGCGSST